MINATSDKSSSSSYPDLLNADDSIPVYILLYIMIFATSSFVGSIGNFLIIVTILTFKKLRKVQNAFVISLAVADLNVCLVTMPASITGVLVGRLWFDQHRVSCITTSLICAPSCVASVFSIAGIAIHRYFFIGRYSLCLKYFDLKHVLVYSACIWAFSLAAHLPNHVGWGRVHYSFILRFCSSDTDLRSYALFYAGLIALALTVTFWFYVKIYHVLRKSSLAKKIIVCGYGSKLTARVAPAKSCVSTVQRNPSITAVANAEKTVAGDDGEPDEDRQTSAQGLQNQKRMCRFLVTTLNSGNKTAYGKSENDNITLDAKCNDDQLEKEEAKKREKNKSSSSDSRVKSEMRMLQVSFRIYVVFFVTRLPLTALLLAQPGESVPAWVYLGAGLMAHCNSTLNFVMYFWSDTSFQASLKHLVNVMMRARKARISCCSC